MKIKVLWVGALATFEVDAMCARWHDGIRVRAVHVTAGRWLYTCGSRWYLLKQQHKKFYSLSVMSLDPDNSEFMTMQKLREDVQTLPLPLIISCLLMVRHRH